jgi:hypothetical protein
MKRNIFSVIWMSCLLLVSGMTFTACSSEDELDTNQYTGGVSLGAFGPCPVLRGGTLYFYGSNLDQVSAVILPGSDPITAINVLQGGLHSKISIVVPAEGGTEGAVILRTAAGQEIKSSTPLTFREDITIEEVYIGTPGNLTGDVGDVLTIKGDYLNLMWGVTFAGGHTVTELIEHDRYTISVQIPKEAASGKVTLTDLAEMPTELQSGEAITITLPTVSGQSATTLKAGGTMTITGDKLDQIQGIQLQGAALAEGEFTVSEDGTSLSFTLPDTAADGDITLVTYSGEKIVAGTVTTVTPGNLAVSGTVKNGLSMTITGSDLDLVSSVAFENAGAYSGAMTVEPAKIVIAKVPDTAQDGNLTLTMKNGKSVTVAYTLVKPTVTSADPAAFVAGTEIVIYGSHLDLVSAITFPGDVPQTVEAKDFAAQEAEGIQLTTPAASYGTGMTLTLKNGTTVSVSGIVTITAATQPAISEAPSGALPGDEITITGKNFNNVQNIYIGTYKVTRYTSKSNTSMTFKVPEAPVGSYKIVMEDYDGNKYDGPAFEILAAETTLWEGSESTGSWANNIGVLSDAGAELVAAGAKVGDIVRFYVTLDAASWQFKIIEGHWSDNDNPYGYAMAWDSSSFETDGNYVVLKFALTETILQRALTQQWWGNVFILQGEGVTLKRVTISAK